MSFSMHTHARTHAHAHNRLMALCLGLSGWASTNLDFTEARDSEWQWHQLGHMQVCTSLRTDNHAITPPYRPDALPATQPTASKHWRPCWQQSQQILYIIIFLVYHLFPYRSWEGNQEHHIHTYCKLLDDICMHMHICITSYCMISYRALLITYFNSLYSAMHKTIW